MQSDTMNKPEVICDTTKLVRRRNNESAQQMLLTKLIHQRIATIWLIRRNFLSDATAKLECSASSPMGSDRIFRS